MVEGSTVVAVVKVVEAAGSVARVVLSAVVDAVYIRPCRHPVELACLCSSRNSYSNGKLECHHSNGLRTSCNHRPRSRSHIRRAYVKQWTWQWSRCQSAWPHRSRDFGEEKNLVSSPHASQGRRQAASQRHGGCAAGWLHTSEPADAILAECSLTECAASLEYVLLRCVLLSQWREKEKPRHQYDCRFLQYQWLGRGAGVEERRPTRALLLSTSV